MKKIVFNPYLPEYEYVPDAEPHLFEGRVYVYGSHDRAKGTKYCEGNYVTWSAPEDDLSDWRYEGEIYKTTQDPTNREGNLQLWAPDVAKGPDGKYYLYYCFSFVKEIGVAVSDSPAGPFKFYGHVKYPQHIHGGKEVQEFMPFDPAIFVDDDNRVYLYYGFAPACEKEMNTPDPDGMNIPEKDKAAIRDIIKNLGKPEFSEYSMCVELEQDMLTVKDVPHEMIPGGHHTAGTGFEGHGFYEASSLRKIGKKYYFVYSSHKSHELCYAVSDRPDCGFVYGGTIVSNGDIGLDGRTKPLNILGNNHGGMVYANDQWYIFYHRQTHGTECSRQGCAEKITLEKDGSIRQVEITSCGLNGGPLPAKGTYPAAIACNITDPTTVSNIDYLNPIMTKQTRITSDATGRKQYITDITDGSMLGYKYFSFEQTKQLALKMKGYFDGKITICLAEDGSNKVGEHIVRIESGEWEQLMIPVYIHDGIYPLYLHFSGSGHADFLSVTFG